jgi:hypothetical protein
MTAWTDTVKKTFKQGRLSNPSYQFKDALKDAKKYYKKGKEKTGDVLEQGKDIAMVAVKKARKVSRKVSKKVRKSMNKLKGLSKKARNAKTFKKRKGRGKKMKGGETSREKCERKCNEDHAMDDFAFDACVRNC